MHLALLAVVVLHATGDVDAAAVIRKAAKGAEVLEVVAAADGVPEDRGEVFHRVEDARGIAALLALIQTEPVNPRKPLHHMCVGHPVTRLSKGGQVLLEFSFDHEALLRSVDPKAWPGDARVTPSSARAMARWYADHGYPLYANRLQAEDDEKAALERFFTAFPPALQKLLRTHQGEAVLDAEGALVAKETPDEVKRLRVFCRGLSLHPRVDVLTFEHQTLHGLTARISPAALEKGLAAIEPGTPEAVGCSRLLFDGGKAGELLAKLSPSTARALAAKFATVSWTEDAAHQRTGSSAFQLDALYGPETEAALRAEAKRSLVVKACGFDEPSQLAARVVLAGRRALKPAELGVPPTPEAMPCEADRAAWVVARSLATGELPTFEQVKAGERRTLQWLVRWLSRRRDRAAIDLGVQLLDATWSTWEVTAWLGGLMTGTSQDATYDLLQQVKAWWPRVRSTWPE